MKQAFLFPGQGSQYVGMGHDLYEHYDTARQVFKKANEALGFDIESLCFEGSEDQLKNTSITQPAILTVSIASWEVLKERGINKPAALAGHSLGEYSALVAAGSLSFSEAVKLVHKRGKFMEECAPEKGGMAAVLGLDKELVMRACEEASGKGVVETANLNCPGQTVIAGEIEALQEAVAICKSYGAKRTVILPVSGPFHSSLMQEAGKKLMAELEKVNFKPPVFPVIMNVTADVLSDPAMIKDLLVKQVSTSVRWEETILKMKDMGINTFIELGPGKVLTGLGKKIIKDSRFYNIEDTATLEKTLDNLKEVI